MQWNNHSQNERHEMSCLHTYLVWLHILHANNFSQHKLCSTEVIEWSICDQYSYVSESHENNPDIRYSGMCCISKVVTTTCCYFLAFSCYNWSTQNISDNSCNKICSFKGFLGIFLPFWVGVSFLHYAEILILLFFFIIWMWMR